MPAITSVALMPPLSSNYRFPAFVADSAELIQSRNQRELPAAGGGIPGSSSDPREGRGLLARPTGE